MSSVEIADDRGNVQHIPVPEKGAGFGSDDRAQVRSLIRSDAGRTAAAVATGHLMASFLGDGATSARAAENAAAVIDEIGGQLQGGDMAPNRIAEPQPVTRTESGLHIVQQPQEAPMPTDYELPPDLDYLNDDTVVDDLALNDEPELDVEPVAAAEQELEFDDDDLLDPRIAALVAERDRLKKQAAHERQVRVKTTRPTWEQEAKRVFRLGDVPLLDDDDLAGIKADSKRSFMTQAKQIADRNKRIIIRVAPTQAAQPSPQEIRTQERAAEWGPPPASAPPSDVLTNDQEARLAKARRSGNLGRIFGAMIDNGSGR